MDDVWFGPGASSADLEACFTALALPDRSGAEPRERPPLLVVATDEQTPRLILASRALFALFGAQSAEALTDRLLGGHDPGARRLATLCKKLTVDSAPRLERLRFSLGLGFEVITFMCRRIAADGTPRFVAAALGLQLPAASLSYGPSSYKPPNYSDGAPKPVVATPRGPTPSEEPSEASSEAPRDESPREDAPAVSVAAREVDPRPSGPASDSPTGIRAIQAMLHERWPAGRTLRFLWQCDRDFVCTQITGPLRDVVGAKNADLVGRNMLDLAPVLDPSGLLADALSACSTFSNVAVAWPIEGAAAAIHVNLGAIPAQDRDRGFEGFRGYGVVHLDKLTNGPVRQLDEGDVRDEAQPPLIVGASPASNVVLFPTTRLLSPEEQKSFLVLGTELREETGLTFLGPHPLAPPPETEPDGSAIDDAESATEDEAPYHKRAVDIARHGLALLDRLTVGLLVSRETIPIFANRYLLDMLGFADEDMLHSAGGLAHLFGGLPGNATGSETIAIRRRDGHIVVAHARMQAIEWDDLPATLLTLQPALESDKRVEALPDAAPINAEMPADRDTHALAAEARELRAILETATDGVAVIDADGNISSLNRSGEALFGRDRSTVIGKPFLSLFAPHNQDLAADYIEGLKSDANKRLLNDGRELLVNAHPDGTIPVFMTLGRLGPSRLGPARPEPDGAPTGERLCALFRDLTHWKKVERDLEAARHEAERANALKSDFLTKVGHEVRTPLNAIVGFAEVMMEERFGPIGNDRYKDYLRDIHTSGTHVLSLVNDLLDLSKIEAGKMELAVEDIDANKIIGECVAIMQPQASRARVIMRLSLASALPHIKADERSLRQIVLNLLSNAIKFNEPGGQVIVATAAPETGQVIIRIRDTGPGMSETDLAAALEPFRQLPGPRTGAAAARPTGTGLGLPLTKALVEANQASLSIRSKIDQGTLVEVAFPPARVLAG